MINAQDRQAYYEAADKWEQDFCRTFVQLGVSINPAKERFKYVPDLITSNGNLADLKVQSSPFRTSLRYGIETNKAWTFNVFDLMHYDTKHGPNFLIYIWLRHGANEGVYLTSIGRIKAVLSRRKEDVRVHVYQNRIQGDGNKSSSFILDITDDNVFKKVA